MSGALVVLEQVVRRFDTDAGSETVLDGLSWSLERGAAAAIVGASGSGKSTLLNLIGALDRPTSGKMLFDGACLADLGDEQLAAMRADKIGFVFQDHHLLPQCTALENVLVPTLARRSSAGPAAVARARALLERVGLTEHAHKRPDQLSGGQRQRVAVVRALINEPLLLLADEPTGSLDRKASDALVELLLEFNREGGLALIVVTHATEIAERIGSIVRLHDGQLHASEAGACATSS